MVRVGGKTKERSFRYHNVWGKKKIELAKVTVTSAAGENREYRRWAGEDHNSYVKITEMLTQK